MRPDRLQQAIGELLGPIGIEQPDDRQDQQPVSHLQRRRGKFADGLLLTQNGLLAIGHHRIDDDTEIEEGDFLE